MYLYSALSYSSAEEYFCPISFSDLLSLNFCHSLYRHWYHCCLTISWLKCSREIFWRLPNYIAFYCLTVLEGIFKIFVTLLACSVPKKPFAFLHILLQHLILLLYFYFFSFLLQSPYSTLFVQLYSCTVVHMNILMNISQIFYIQPHEIKKHLF
jgi:hypothetical protein